MGENNNNRIRPEDLEDGILLKDMVKRFNADRTELNLFNVFQVMRDSFVWVPCNAILSETDSRNMHELPTTDYVGRGFCYAARRHEPAGIVYPAEQGMSTMPLSH